MSESGITCPECWLDIGDDPRHMCGLDPIVQADQIDLEPFPGFENTFRCKYCKSGVGRQHYECIKYSVDTMKRSVPANIEEYHGRWRGWCPFIIGDVFADSKEEVVKIIAEKMKDIIERYKTKDVLFEQIEF